MENVDVGTIFSAGAIILEVTFRIGELSEYCLL